VKAHAKINLALVVGPLRDDGKHEVVTVLQRLDLADEVTLERSERLQIEGFDADTILRAALESIAAAAGVEPSWRVRIEKRIPVAAGLGGGSSDAAAALLLANERLPEPLADAQLRELAASLGSDVPFFLAHGPQLGTGDGSTLERIELRQDYAVLLLLPNDAVKESTAAVYARFDREARFEQRRKYLLDTLRAGDLASLPPNDLASSPLAPRLVELGAFRADVSGAGPAVYGLFDDEDQAERAAAALAGLGRTRIVAPAW
jgi:4-diphosphocytidyl-2-C-methyl-D-erythritol kinase